MKKRRVMTSSDERNIMDNNPAARSEEEDIVSTNEPIVVPKSNANLFPLKFLSYCIYEDEVCEVGEGGGKRKSEK